MHFLVFAFALGVAIAFAFGERAARFFVGSLLALAALGILTFCMTVAIDLVSLPEPSVVKVHYGR
jgi:hypothetical protein